MNEEQIVFSRKLAYLLRMQGFKIIRKEVHPYNPEYDCYVFANSPEFQKAFLALREGMKNGR